MSNTHSQLQAKVTNMSKPVFGDKIMTKTLSKSQIRSHIKLCICLHLYRHFRPKLDKSLFLRRTAMNIPQMDL